MHTSGATSTPTESKPWYSKETVSQLDRRSQLRRLCARPLVQTGQAFPITVSHYFEGVHNIYCGLTLFSHLRVVDKKREWMFSPSGLL